MTSMLHTTTGAQLRLWLDEPKSDDDGIFCMLCSCEGDGGHNSKLSCVQIVWMHDFCSGATGVGVVVPRSTDSFCNSRESSQSARSAEQGGSVLPRLGMITGPHRIVMCF